MSENCATHAYAGICRECNGTMMLTVDEIKHRNDVAGVVAECISAGFVIERMTIEEARDRAKQWCMCSSKKGK